MLSELMLIHTLIFKLHLITTAHCHSANDGDTVRVLEQRCTVVWSSSGISLTLDPVGAIHYFVPKVVAVVARQVWELKGAGWSPVPGLIANAARLGFGSALDNWSIVGWTSLSLYSSRLGMEIHQHLVHL